MFGDGCKILGKVEYKIRYAIVPSRSIFNLLGPNIKNKNPEHYVNRRNSIDNFYNNLEESILKHGVRNPVSTSAGNIKKPQQIELLPEDMQKDRSKIWVCDFQGGSRLWIAQKYDLDVPCIIADFVNRFTDFEELNTADEIMAKFVDKPQDIRLYHWGVYFHHIPHIHMNK